MEPATTVSFAGRTWAVKASSEPVGPGPNLFSASADNVWVDTVGQLHLRITHRADRWLASEVILENSLGYGRYRFTLASPVGRFDPAVVLGLFTYGEDPGTSESHREIDVEFGIWPDAPESTARYTVQPGHGHSFAASGAAPTMHEFSWTRREVRFTSESAEGTCRWRYRGADVPAPGDERARVNLWLHGGRPPADGGEVHVVLSDFSFLRA